MERKPPRRTRERILDTALRLMNDFGEPNVNTTVIAEEMKISPGNLYYHFKNKDDIVNSIFEAFEREIQQLLAMPRKRLPNIEDAWLVLHLLFELIWKYRFFYQDLNNLLISNRRLELRFKALLVHKATMARWMCEGLARQQQMKITAAESAALGANMVVVATFWLSYEYALNPRRVAEPAALSAALARGCFQVMALTAPYLQGDARVLFERLAAQYLSQ